MKKVFSYVFIVFPQKGLPRNKNQRLLQAYRSLISFLMEFDFGSFHGFRPSLPIYTFSIINKTLHQTLLK